MPSHVLVPIDESSRSLDALEFTFETFPDARITVLHVLDPGDLIRSSVIEGELFSEFDDVKGHYDDAVDAVFEDARTLADEYDIDIETEDVLGGVSASIIEYVTDNDIDHIVIGSHGRRGPGRILLGNVAEKVSRRSPVPVTIVR